MTTTEQTGAIAPASLRSRVVWSALAVLLLTDLHHAYGAYVYHTPWRNHVVVLSLPAMAIILWSRSRSMLVAVTLVVPLLGIGAFEGFYNHLVKDVLYFGGASQALMTRLYPPPTYEMPSDAFFESTGVLQAFLGAITAWHLHRFRTGGRSAGTGRLAPGTRIADRRITAISGDMVRIPDPDRLVHLQFRRFAGCPVCNLHLQSFVRRHSQVEEAGVREVVVFHSPAEELRLHAGHLPFALIADPDKRLYVEFGVESGARALLDPRAWGAICLGVFRSLLGILRRRAAVPAMRPRGGRLGLPADFLIGRDGRVLASKYGEHADDQWSVDELLRISRARP